MMGMGFVLIYERAECRKCAQFNGKLSRVERLRLPPGITAVGKCEHKKSILLKNNGGAARSCPEAKPKQRLKAFRVFNRR